VFSDSPVGRAARRVGGNGADPWENIMKVFAPLRAGVVLCAALAVVGAAAAPVVAVPDPVKDVCGGQLRDYVGAQGNDTPFEGTVSLTGGGSAYVSIIPLTSDGRVRVEVERSKNDSKYAISDLNVKSDNTGIGTISFKTYAGNAWSTQVECNAGSTRVVRITGQFEVVPGPDDDQVPTFDVSRA
jgi:hypothetical protein